MSIIPRDAKPVRTKPVYQWLDPGRPDRKRPGHLVGIHNNVPVLAVPDDAPTPSHTGKVWSQFLQTWVEQFEGLPPLQTES